MFGAVGARNCLHRARIPSSMDKTNGVILFFTYEPYIRTSVITDFFVKHPRIMVPLLGKVKMIMIMMMLVLSIACHVHVHAYVDVVVDVDV